ncbi:gliding motility-associated lipoprotein GldJ [Flavobacterium sp. 9]|uniref:gliding motility lipoprotein GldJ n=1 Tax=Flavobacterium sp. 9 TaxID=2035198 RepID=UPI000C1857E7|nr:gliding motility lipoprotein GldJ [Flavobacterium sp. 9]PIF30185.1 gliding motility-associated lipoprotein GldJ [Flavobacterium sp. 9]
MRNYKIITSLLLITILFSCNKQPLYDKSSRATGWQMSGTTKGVIGAQELKGQDTAPGLIFVEGGSFVMGKVEDDIMHDWNNQATQQHVQSFYIDETEVTNAMYFEYIRWIKKVFPPTIELYKNIYSGVIPDSLVWRNRLGSNEAMVKNYLRHPAYSDYPVVGVSWIQATQFCKWRTERVNEASLEKNGYLKQGAKINDVTAESSFNTETYLVAPTRTYGGNSDIVLKGASGVRIMQKQPAKNANQTREEINLYAERSTGIIFPEYRLPTEAEWEYAAAANVGQRVYNNYKGKRRYPWSGGITYSKGEQLANFKQATGDYNGITGWPTDHGEITNEVRSYPPNDFGLYDMGGNVAEWVADVYRPTIDDQNNDFNYFRGSVFTKNKKGKDGKIELVTKETIKYDTLSNGKIVALDFPGEIKKIPVDDDETFLRQNFDRSYEINFSDGDSRSTNFLKSNTSNSNVSDKDNTYKMYNSPKNTITLDSLGNMIRKYDKSNKRTTLIGDNTRVYKGGSWRDRAYWLNPTQRRYMSQDFSTDFIGFRCAMSRVGAKAKRNKTRKN